MCESIRTVLEDLTGQEASFDANVEEAVGSVFARSGIGYSQLNELLLLYGYDRASYAFFCLLLALAGETAGTAFRSLECLRTGVDCFRIRAILRFGNVKHAFKYLAGLSEEGLTAEMNLFDARDESHFTKRHDPLVPIEPIPGDQTYYLGYLVKRAIDERLRQNPNDVETQRECTAREKVVAIGKRNHLAYLASDHMDVYVATSMRERHEYQMVNEVVKEVFSCPELAKLKIRWFDPTQAYCEDHIDKGLVEGLMLKRATCTLYLAQESDTLGKDSELASTLAQGKPVIAYIPSIKPDAQDSYVEQLLSMIKEGAPHTGEAELVLSQLRIFCPDAAWSDPQIQSWVVNPGSIDLVLAKRRLGDSIREHYDRRANTLKLSHPLGIQVHLETGVANGVLVARSASQCADLINRVLTNRLEFDLCEKEITGMQYLLLKERTSGSIFRVVTGDRFLTNVFWNFYLSQ